MFNKLMGLASLGSSLANVAVLQRFLEGVVGIIALAILSAMMAGLLVYLCLYGLFAALENSGVGTAMAFAIVISIACLITALLLSLTFRQINKIRFTTSYSSSPDPLSFATRVTSAFVQGFLRKAQSR